MILALNIDINNLLYTCLYLSFFILSYFVILSSRLENLFKQGQTWQIKAAQILLALICSYFLTSGIMSLINSTQF